MSELWILLGIGVNAILFIWGVLYLAKAIKDNNKDNGL
jgi:hypothetical protein|tara:strand:+ start:36 stop:149 length:114 start_codon:yes stop_codon:yes gene_type:complete